MSVSDKLLLKMFIELLFVHFDNFPEYFIVFFYIFIYYIFYIIICIGLIFNFHSVVLEKKGI